MPKLDRRVTKTLNLIDETGYDLLTTTSFERLSVAAICQTAQIGRSTFYQYYLDKYDWLEKQVTIYTDKFQALMATREEDFKQGDSLTQLVTELLPDQERLKVLLVIHVDEVDLEDKFQEILQAALPQYLKHAKNLNVPVPYLQEIYASTAMTYIRYAIFHGLDDQISLFMNQAFNAVLAVVTKPT
ncbi:TetR/AcrR family transcriptional regulator [Levilactobacillus cerevisiae]|uniref:TetR/AcrR family transcriptional regulator n=1 Tax=Levilactobacillus cerevisiae TaxID=1704076 RepID=UPI000F7660BB|nr:TetR/AcrR family transcriptional regulator [Levilactobacillus cerevisiae]